MSKGLVLAAAASVLLAGAGMADETWNSEIGGTIVWEDDVDGTSVFSFDRMLPDQRARLYLPGLPDTMDDRGTYFGYWIDPAGGGCGALLTGIDGLQSDAWGSAIITFDRRSFPSGWTALMGDCLDPPYFGMRADAP